MAREYKKAVELADKLCESIENVFSFFMGDLSHKRRIGILNFRGWTTINKTIFKDGKLEAEGSKNDVFITFDLDQPIFKNEKLGVDRIWNLITKKQKNEVESRLLIAIEWIGKGIIEKDLSKALVQFVFGIEAMLQPNKKEFISPSISSQISDWLAFLLENDEKGRRRISKYAKALYAKRSAIAHGSVIEITMNDIQIAKELSREMIFALLESPYKEMTKMEQLSYHMTTLKYS